ncbi:tetratricopeptide repeat protein [Thiobacter aerophilum]|uniref:Tetratricopeptide repeat protein n=1 Tax=Thiobacter aerophilum TaxID=3121275 RepID=A0ABV0EFD9_9BURK
MSVINRMLQELDARHEQTGALPGTVRPAPPPAPNRLRWLVVTGVLVVLLALGGGFAWREWGRAQPPRAAVVPAPAAVEKPLPAPAAVEKPLPAPARTASAAAAATPSPAPEASHALAEQSLPRQTLAAAAQDQPSAVGKQATPALRTPSPTGLAASPAAPAQPRDAGVVKQISPAQRADQHYREALAQLASGRGEQAEALLKEALRLDPRHLGARQALLAQWVNARRLDEAEALLKAGLAEPTLAKGETAAALAMALARLQLERAGASAALATLDRYAPEAVGNAQYAAFEAALLQRLDRHAEAIARFQAALQGDPQRAQWWLGLALSLEAEGRAEQAIQAFERARSLPGLSPDLRAFAEQSLGRLRSRP